MKKIDLRKHNPVLIHLGTFLVMLLILFVIAEGVSRIAIKYTKGGPTAVNLNIFEANETYVWGHLPSAVDYSGYGDPTPEVRINKLGFRDDEMFKEKPPNTKRILVLGDSFTFGMGVKMEDNYTEVLQRLLNEKDPETRHEVVNMGSIGYTTDNEFLILKEKGMQLDPDLVLVEFFVGNDVTEMRRHLWITNENEKLIAVEDTRHYVDEDNRLRYKGEEEPISYFVNFVYTRWQILTKKIGVYGHPNNGPTLTWPAFLEPGDEHGDPSLPEYWQMNEIALKQMKELLDEKGIKMVVFALPMDVQVSERYWDKYSGMYFDDEAFEKSRPQAKLKEITESMGVDFIDLLPYFRNVANEAWHYYEQKDPHWTIEGNAFAAQVIANNLEL